MSFDYDENMREAARLERHALDRLNDVLATIAADLHWYWRMGDGQGGFVLEKLRSTVIESGGTWPYDVKEPQKPAKAKISRSLAKRVHERESYRCVTCGDHVDLCCDHIVPESKAGPTTFENLQSMCRPCNSRKGNRA